MSDSFSRKKSNPRIEGSKINNERGKILFVFRPKTYINGIVLWVAVALFLIIAMVYYTSGSRSGDPSIKFWMLMIIFPPALITLYHIFLVAFENMVIFEKGLYAPQTSERGVGMYLMRRTFIPFAAIQSFDVIRFSPMSLGNIKFFAFDRLWRVTGSWDIHLIVPILESGIKFKELKYKPQQSPSIAKGKR